MREDIIDDLLAGAGVPPARQPWRTPTYEVSTVRDTQSGLNVVTENAIFRSDSS